MFHVWAHLTAFILDDTSRMFVLRTALEDRESVALRARAGLLVAWEDLPAGKRAARGLPAARDPSSRSSGSPPPPALYGTKRHPASSVLPSGFCGLETVTKTLILWLLLRVTDGPLSLIQKSWVFNQHP